jgi:type IV pilus assembly protein PilQ
MPVFPVERAEAMNAKNAVIKTSVRLRSHAGAIARAAIVLSTVAVMATATLMVSAASEPVRLIGVSAQGSAIVIEATDPVAYTVTRPDAMTLVVDLRGATVADAASKVQPQGPVSGIRLEQSTSPDGLTMARVRIALTRAAEYSVKSARNTIRIELSSTAAAKPSAAPLPAPIAAPGPVSSRRETPPAAAPSVAAAASDAAATAIEQVRAARKGGGAIITISGNGKLNPTGVSESRDLPRRLIIDFPNVTARAAAQTPGDGDIVKRVRVGQNSQTPLVTRVVMEIAEGATYSLQRGAAGSRDLSVVFEAAKVAGTSLRSSGAAAEDAAFAVLGAETITLAQALANGAALAPRDTPVDVGALTGTRSTAPPAAVKPTSKSTVAPTAPNAPNPSTGAAILQAKQTTGPQGAPLQRAATQSAVAPTAGAQTIATQTAPAAQAQTPPAQPPPVTSPVIQGPQSQQIAVGQEKKYVGHPISMDFSGTDLRSVLRLFAEISGLNMIIDPDVQGSVDVVFNDVPWDQALDVILRQAQLDYTVDGTIVRIARIETLRREQDARSQLAASAANAGALAVRTYTLSYAKAEQAAPLVQRAVLSSRGNVQIDTRTNTLIITDLPAKLDTVSQLLTTLDRAEPQVEIEARIITTTRDFARALGVQWGFNGRVAPEIGNTTGLAFPNNGSLGGRAGGLQGATTSGSDIRANPADQAGTAVGLAVPAATSAVGLALGSINGAFNLDIALSALERSGKGRILSTPRVTTQNNVEAEITQGVQIPVQTEANNTVTVTFKDAALTLKVTPQITAANTVIMQITLENASPGALVDTGTASIPSIDTQRAITKVQVSDGMTTVMGGIFVSREQTTNDRTPILHRIPFFGWLFKRDTQVDESRELLIFITPRIQKG